VDAALPSLPAIDIKKKKEKTRRLRYPDLDLDPDFMISLILLH